MIQTETITIRGKQFRRTWSDAGLIIERDGAQYSEAIDPISFERVYTETDIQVDDSAAVSATEVT